MSEYPIGRILNGDAKQIDEAAKRFNAIAVDEERRHQGEYPYSLNQTTLRKSASVTGPGTFFGKAQRTLTFTPASCEGWWINRTDQDEQLPIPVSVRSIWTTARNIVLRSGSPHNYLRMVEHIVAMRLGMGLDNVVVETASGDPPLFDRGNLDICEAIDSAGIVETDRAARFITVKEPVTFSGGRGDFLTFIPARAGDRLLHVDCAVDFASAIGQQRIQFDVTPETFRYGAQARTNAPHSAYLYAKTIGQLFADTRNLGYTAHNILIHGRTRYVNDPKMPCNGKHLEPVWHRATLDLLAAAALLDTGRLAGTLVSFRAGHTQDCRLCSLLYLRNLLTVL